MNARGEYARRTWIPTYYERTEQHIRLAIRGTFCLDFDLKWAAMSPNSIVFLCTTKKLFTEIYCAVIILPKLSGRVILSIICNIWILPSGGIFVSKLTAWHGDCRKCLACAKREPRARGNVFQTRIWPWQRHKNNANLRTISVPCQLNYFPRNHIVLRNNSG